MSMDGVRKTAVFLLSLEPSVAAEILGKLPREQVERVTFEIANAERIARDEQELVLKEFKTSFATRSLTQPVGPETARDLLERSLKPSEAEPIQMRLDEQLQTGPFAFLHDHHADDIRRLLEEEHPQTIAVVAAQLPADLTALVISGFSSDRQTDIVSRIARLGPTDPHVLDVVAQLLKERIGQAPQRRNGLQKAANVLRETGGPHSRTVLKSIVQTDAGLAEKLRGSLFSFQELENLDDVTLCSVLEQTDQLPWAVALKGTSRTLQQRVSESLPAPVAQGLKNEMGAMGPLRLKDINDAQSQIIDAILTLAAEEQIDLPQKRRTPNLVAPHGQAKISRLHA